VPIHTPITMPSPADIAQQFDSIEDTIAAFSESSLYLDIFLPYRGLNPLALQLEQITNCDAYREWRIHHCP
jgi:hypothetical protein